MTRSEAAKARWGNEEYRQKMIASLKGKRVGNRATRTEENRKKVQASNPNKKPVYQFSLEGEFIAEYPSIRDASKKTGTPFEDIRNFILRREQGCKIIYRESGYIWSSNRNCTFTTPKKRSVKELVNDHPTQEVLDKIHSTSLPNGPAEVTQYDYKGNVIARYATLGEAGRKNGFNTAAISNCCRRKRNTAYGYIWAYTK